MKKILSIFAAFLCFSCFSQVKVSSYYSTYFDREYEISASLDEKSSYIKNLYINVEGERKSQDISLCFDSPTYLKRKLIEVRDKYKEWINVAKENGVTDINKDIPVTMPKLDVCWYGTKWYFSFNKYFNFRFMFLNNKPSIVLHETVKSSSNEYIDTKFYWVFSSVEELDRFISLLDIDAFTKKLTNKKDNAALFN